MCFSATASFIVSGGVAIAGVASLRAATPKERMIAVIPLVFAVQQAVEGVQWLAIDNGTTCPAAGYGYLMFAYALWPVYIPAMVYALDRASRSRVRWFLGLGIAAAIWNVWHLFANPLAIYPSNGYLVYDLGIYLGEQAALFYVIAISGALFLSRIRAFSRAGLIVFGTAVLTALLARPAFPSVWCFVAAVASVLVYLYVSRRKK